MAEYSVLDLSTGVLFTVHLNDSELNYTALWEKIKAHRRAGAFDLFSAVSSNGSWLDSTDDDYAKLVRGNEATRQQYATAENTLATPRIEISGSLPKISDAASTTAVHFLIADTLTDSMSRAEPINFAKWHMTVCTKA